MQHVPDDKTNLIQLRTTRHHSKVLLEEINPNIFAELPSEQADFLLGRGTRKHMDVNITCKDNNFADVRLERGLTALFWLVKA